MKFWEYIVISVISFSVSFSLLIIYFIKEITKEKYFLKKNVNRQDGIMISKFLYNYATKLLFILGYSLLLFIFFRTNYLDIKPLSFEMLIRISTTIITLLIAFLFAKLFQIRREKKEVQLSLKPLSNQLTGYRRLIYFIMKTDPFWIKKHEVAIARKKHPDVGYYELELDFERDNYRKAISFRDDESFNPTRVNIYYIMEEITRSQFEGWKYEQNSDIVYSKRELEILNHNANQMWYYFEHKHDAYTKGDFDWTSLSSSTNADRIIEEFNKSFPEFETHTEIDNWTFANLSSRIKQEVIEKMLVSTKDNHEYYTRNMRVVKNLMVIVLVLGLLLPIIGMFVSNFTLEYILGYTSYMGIGTVIIWIIFELKSIIFEELNSD